MSKRFEPELVAELLPVWLEQEMHYALDKYNEVELQGNILGDFSDYVTSAGYGEYAVYGGRFMNFYVQADGNERVLLRASQALGKFVNAGLALLGTTVVADTGLDKRSAYAVATLLAEDSFAEIRDSHPVDATTIPRYLDDFVYPSLWRVSEAIKHGNTSHAIEHATCLLVSQAQLMTDVTCEIGMLAQPGISSTDPNNELREWAA